ncbi:DUF2399 domain-containing protein [Streptomyces sp. CHD11]|uniref:DUF2399 domain-containing protein n=1 Tax=Streptomyces sp. CHD11 TaxID=2741325 RepID=UPI001BFBFBAE|nr:DUF2399 domain-containing protein [Streptomyces sp. CHD11]MBT3153880.1 DUF2399 domain-containing protein [Streptomyces sp. CHD11]
MTGLREAQALTGATVPAPWNPALAAALTEHAVRIEEEPVLGDLLGDLRGDLARQACRDVWRGGRRGTAASRSGRGVRRVRRR